MKGSTAALCLGALLAAGSVYAGPNEYVFTPGVEYGEKEVDIKFGTWREPSGDKEREASIGFGFGVTENWFTEAYLIYSKENQDGTRLEAFEFENKFQLTEPGKYFADVGLVAEIEIPREHGQAYEFKFGPLFQKDLGKVQLNANLLFEREFHDHQHHDTEIGYQLQAKYRLQPTFEFGAQAFGSMGKWDHWDDSSAQKHRIGPAVFGKFKLGDKRAIKYNAAYLLGVSDAAPDRNFRMQAEYEF